MVEMAVPFISALWLGILTSISPCPLATNIAAISFLSKKINHPKLVLWSGIAYTLGRVFSYTILGTIIITSLVSVPATANFLQKYMNRMIGPILLFAGLFLLGIIKMKIPRFYLSSGRQNALAEAGVRGSFMLGAIFALSFCPIAAALFFGSLIPLALNNRYGIVMPFLYGTGTGIPVLLFAVSIAVGVRSVSRWSQKARTFESYTRKITGIIFILVGAYYTWQYIIAPNI